MGRKRRDKRECAGCDPRRGAGGRHYICLWPNAHAWRLKRIRERTKDGVLDFLGRADGLRHWRMLGLRMPIEGKGQPFPSMQ